MRLITCYEHDDDYEPEADSVLLDRHGDRKNIFFQNGKEACIEARREDGKPKISAGYFVGLDWLEEPDVAVCVRPKLRVAEGRLNYFKLLGTVVDGGATDVGINRLYEIKFDARPIEVKREDDLLTPIIVYHFLLLLRRIVQKGLRKSYYKVKRNISSSIKGRVNVHETIRRNWSAGIAARTVCSYDEFGINCVENRLLKAALLSIQKYFAVSASYHDKPVGETLKLCIAAFHDVESVGDFKRLTDTTNKAVFGEYGEAMNLAKLIIRRFGYRADAPGRDTSAPIAVPPFWINMPLLFEFYVLGLLREEYGGDMEFQFDANYGSPDYLINDGECRAILDAKYKPTYGNRGQYLIADIRQLSGYARDKAVLEKLGFGADKPGVADCIVIYPEQSAPITPMSQRLYERPIRAFAGFYKVPVRLPVTASKVPNEWQ